LEVALPLPLPTPDEGLASEPPYRGSKNGHSWTLYQGDAKTELRKLPSESVDCVVTSPPYFWQRDYGVDGQVGLESSIDGYVQSIRDIFAELRRVIRKDATVFLNLGDTYYSAKGQPHGPDAKQKARRFGLRLVDQSGLGLPRKSLIGIPWRVALALVEDGWTLRSSIIWVRESSIPEPTSRDRPWRKYEFVFLLTRSTRYYFNREAILADEDVWVIEPDRNARSRGTHFAPFPRDLVRKCLESGCRPGGVVLDPFVGGGTTMSVGLEMGHPVIGIDLSKEFCDFIVQQLQEAPGLGIL
jgi:DNA modification methylase